MPQLTIGMATYRDYDGVFFSVQALRMYQDVDDVEILVIDNYGCADTRAFTEAAGARYIEDLAVQGTSAPRNAIFREARSPAVLSIDSHVLLDPGVVARLKRYYRDHPGTKDLLQGPLLHDSLDYVSTHFDPVWNGQMWGTWGTDERGLDPDNPPFDIPMQGVGLFSCRREAWPGFNPRFRGFGAEEGYLHEKIRQRGGRTLCVPWLRWSHRFGRPNGVPYPLSIEDKFRNYLIGHHEVGFDLSPIVEHYRQFMQPEAMQAVIAEVFGPDPAALAGTGLEPLVPVGAASAAAGPLVSCLLPVPAWFAGLDVLLDEAVESFLRQEYPDRELVILNDDARLRIHCDAPGVRVENVDTRFHSDGSRRNALSLIAGGAVLAPWPVDIVALPWALSIAMAKLRGNHAFFPGNTFAQEADGTIVADERLPFGTNGAVYARDAWDAVGRHPYAGDDEDVTFAQRLLHAELSIVPPDHRLARLGIDDWYLIERYPAQRVPATPPRDYRIRPRWTTDWVALTAEVPAPAHG